MRVLSKRIVGFALVFLIAVSAYLTIVQIVEAFKPDGILKAFSVRSLRRPDSSGKFLMGDTLVVEAKSDVATDYELQVRVNSSMVFESEWAGGSPVRLEVPLLPPAFVSGRSYTLGLNGFVTNSPIPGACFADFASYTFDVASTQTTVGLNSTYDNSTDMLYSSASLTDVDGYPIVNETVGFYLRLKSTNPLTDGWLPLGSIVTDSNGMALLSLGFRISCQMAVKALHGGNANFGPCGKTVDVEETSNFTESFLYLPQETFSERHTSEIGILDTGNVSMTIDIDNPYALLPVNVTTKYTSNNVLDGNYSTVVGYYLDNLSGCVGFSSPLVPLPGGPPYVYQPEGGAWPWPQGPNATLGLHNLTAGIIPLPNGNRDLIAAGRNGTGIIASGSLTVNITACPSNVVLHLPEAMYSNVLPVTLAFSRAWPCMKNEEGGFTASSLAFQFNYDGINYRIDQPPNALMPINLYVNGSQIGANVTDANGLASFQFPLSFSGAYSNLNINCTVNCSRTVFQQVNVTRSVTFTNVTVSDSSGGNGLFQLNSTVNGQGASNDLTIYVETENQVGLSTVLNGSAVWAAPASVLIGKPLGRTNDSLCVSVPQGSTFLRVASLYNISTTTALYPYADINRDGKVDGRDNLVISRAYGTFPGYANWNWRADLNLDMKVDGRDIILWSRSFGKDVTYLSVSNYTTVNVSFKIADQQWNVALLDASGCASVTGASWVNFTLGGNPVGAVVEFFNCTSGDQATFTDNSGQSVASWGPPETGNCSCSSINSGLVALKGYLAITWLPPRFQAVTSQPISLTSIQDSVVNGIYLNVTKRPVSLTLTNSSYAVHTVVEKPLIDLYVMQSDDNDHSSSNLIVGYQHVAAGIEERRIYVKYNISDISAGATILSARIKAYCYDASTLGSARQYQISRVAGYWDESITWAVSTHIGFYGYTSVVSWSPGEHGWMVWDVTPDVQLWHSGTNNYGHVIMDLNNNLGYECYCSLDSDRARTPGCPVLEVTYVLNSCLPIGLEADLVDGITGSSMSGENITFSITGSSVPTNSSGVATTQWAGPSSSAAYNVVASYAGNATCEAASDSLCLDFRTSTSLSVNDMINGEVLFDISTHEQRQFDCSVNPPIAASEGVEVFVNGSWYTNTTLGYDTASFSWSPMSEGVYYINVTYGGDSGYQLSQFIFVPVVQVSPVCLGFNVTPSEFKPGDNVTLYAQAVNPLDGNPLSNVKVQFLQNGTNFIGPSQYIQTGSDGVATVSWQYPFDGSICTVNASVKSDNSIGNCSLAVQPVTLSVGNETQLLLSAWRDLGGTGHTIYAGLVNASGSPLQNYTVTLNVNGTAYPLTTNGTGYVSLHLALQPGDTSANMYQILATFNGTNPRSASLNASDPYGDQYAVCTTTQYDLRPSTNSSTLAVLLQSTDAMTAAKTPGQMQQEAKDSGWLRGPDSEWVWGWPFYRMHLKICFENTTIDLGFNPILPGGGTIQCAGLGVFNDVTQELMQELQVDFIGLFVEYIAAKVLSFVPFTMAAAGLALILKAGTQAVFLMNAWNDKTRLLAIALVSAVMAIIAAGGASLGTAFLALLMGAVWAGTYSAASLLINGFINAGGTIAGWRSWIDGFEIALDLGFAVTAFARYNGRI